MSKVLIVDDSKTMRRIVRQALGYLGVDDADIQEAENGALALTAVETHSPRLVLCDVNMPELDGFGFLERLRESGALERLDVVMITSRSSLASRKRLLELGAEEVVRKPFAVQTLHAVLDPYLRRLGDPGAGLGLVAEPSASGSTGPTAVPLNDDAEAALDEALSDTLSMTAFVDAQREPFEAPTDTLLYAAIEMTAGHVGTMYVALTEDAASSVFDCPPEELHDAIAELVNMLVGEFLRQCEVRASGTTAEFDFGLPQRGTLAPTDPIVSCAMRYGLDGGEDAVYVSIVNPGPSSKAA